VNRIRGEIITVMLLVILLVAATSDYLNQTAAILIVGMAAYVISDVACDCIHLGIEADQMLINAMALVFSVGVSLALFVVGIAFADIACRSVDGIKGKGFATCSITAESFVIAGTVGALGGRITFDKMKNLLESE